MIKELHNITLGNLLDLNSIEDIGDSHNNKFDGVYCGLSYFEEKKVVFILQDYKYKGGSSGLIHLSQMNLAIERAIEEQCPLIFVLSTGGLRATTGIVGLSNGSKILKLLNSASGYIPIFSIINGTCAGLGAYISALSDCSIFIKDKSQVFLTGPKVIKIAIGKDITKEQLGGTRVHSELSGIATNVVEDIASAQYCLSKLLRLFPTSFVANQNLELFDTAETIRNFNSILPDNPFATYDIHKVINQIADPNRSVELYHCFAKNIVTAFASINGSTIGIIANQPKFLSGCLDVKTTKKIIRFIQICDAFNIPLLFIVDCPGFFPGEEQEKLGAVNIGSKAAHILAACKTPKITLIIRRMTGGSYAILNCKSIGADYVMAWASKEIKVMGDTACKKICNENEVETKPINELIEEGIIDEEILPNETRNKIIKAINIAIQTKRKNTLVKRRIVLPM